MEYKRISDNWREAGKTGDIGRAVELLEEQITKNLLDVRNAFAVDVADDPDAAFGFLFDIGDIKPEYRDMMGEFCYLGEELEYISMDRGMADCRHPDEDYLGRYVLLEEKVISAMEKFDGDYILRELCRTLKGQLRELRNTFCCLCCAYEKKSISVINTAIKYTKNHYEKREKNGIIRVWK